MHRSLILHNKPRLYLISFSVEFCSSNSYVIGKSADPKDTTSKLDLNLVFTEVRAAS